MLALSPLLALAAALAAAAPSALCVKKSKTGIEEPLTLVKLRECHERRILDLEEDYAARHQREAPEALRERWEETQRAEVQDYLARHPHRATMATDGAPPEAQRPEDSAAANGAQGAPAQGSIDSLTEKLWSKADGGSKGITPEMAKDIAEYLKSKQDGEITVEMRGLLEAVQKDGANLSSDTMRLLQKAARQAEKDGLPLDNIDPNVRRQLLNEEIPQSAGPSL